MEKKNYKYIDIAKRVEGLIQEDVFKAGDKLPSVRELCEQNAISLGTASQVYLYLEGKGVIEARPKSGYYVLRNNKRSNDAWHDKKPVDAAGIVEMIDEVFQSLSPNGVIDLSTAAPAHELLPYAQLNHCVNYVLRTSKFSCLNYEDIQGNKELRKQIARLAFIWGGATTPEQILVTSGCMEALVLSLQAVTKPADTVAIESPTYFGIFQMLRNLGLNIIEIDTHPEKGIDLNSFESLLKKKKINACVFIPNFNNPLGSKMPDANKKHLVDLVTKYKIPLIEDDIYGEVYFGNYRPKTCKSFDTEEWVLHCSSVSKSLAPGYRIGWCINERFNKNMKTLKLFHSVTGTTLTEATIAHFLSRRGYVNHMQQLRKTLKENCANYRNSILHYFPKECTVSQPAGGLSLWIKLPKKESSYTVFRQAVKHKIAIVPGQIFSTKKDYSDYIRITYGKPYNKEIESALEVLGDVIRKV